MSRIIMLRSAAVVSTLPCPSEFEPPAVTGGKGAAATSSGMTASRTSARAHTAGSSAGAEDASDDEGLVEW
jgi:hypothetical protein